MNNYIIYTDSSCDMDDKYLEEWGIKSLSLTFRFTDSEKEYSNSDMSIKEFYAKMRDGKIAKTSAINAATFEKAFEEELSAGNDVIYLGFSSGISTTNNSARIAMNNLIDKYPERKLIVIDTLSMSTGLGLLLYFAKQKRDAGATIDELAAYVEEIKSSICHWFTVDDLVYLKRGGRISPAVAFVGGIMGIKPILHTDDEGKLVNMFKARGRKASIVAIADEYTKRRIEGEENVAFICHGDCIEDAEALANILKEKHGTDVKVISYTGAVIGAHSGPGTLALFFRGNER